MNLVLDDKLKLDVPLTMHEISILEWGNFREEEHKLNDDNSMSQLIKAVSQVVKGDVHKLPIAGDAEEIRELYDTGWTITLDSLAKLDVLSIHHVHAHLANIIHAYTPNKLKGDFEYEHDGKTYIIQRGEARNYITGAAFTAGESVSVLEFQRIAKGAIKNDFEWDNNIMFNLHLDTVACLLREPDVELPWDRRKRVEYIDKMKKIAIRFSAAVVLDIDFFLSSILKSLLEINPTSTTSSPLSKLRRLRQKSKHSAKAKRSLKLFLKSLDGGQR
jgi:hypothetical protein